MVLSRDVALGILALVAWSRSVSALDPDICASANTATMTKMTYDLQSNGWCHDQCSGDYAFSITKGYDCWCSNYAPDEDIQVNLSDCNFPCWGYPQEPCGGDGVFSYVRLRNVQPSGTRGGTEPPKSTTSSKPPSRPTENEEEEEEEEQEEEQEPETTSESPSSTSDPELESTESTTTESSTTSSSTTSSEPASTAVLTVTADGTIKTVFVGPTNPPETDGDTDGAAGELMDGSSGGGDGISKGALAGIIVGVALGIIAIVAVGLWWFFRRRKNQQQEDDYQEDPSIRGSSSGMMGAGQRPEMSTSGGSPGSPNTSSNRNSALMIDPRMDPFKQGLYVRSASHESINTLRDDHDYSRRIQQRTLRATNPDPEIDG